MHSIEETVAQLIDVLHLIEADYTICSNFLNFSTQRKWNCTELFPWYIHASRRSHLSLCLQTSKSRALKMFFLRIHIYFYESFMYRVKGIL